MRGRSRGAWGKQMAAKYCGKRRQSPTNYPTEQPAVIASELKGAEIKRCRNNARASFDGILELHLNSNGELRLKAPRRSASETEGGIVIGTL